MSIIARELEAFFEQMHKPDLATRAGELAVEAKKLEDQKIGSLDVRRSQVELPRGIRREHLKPDEPLSKEAFAAKFDTNGIHRTPYARDLVDRIALTNKAPDLELVWPSGRDLGLTQAAPYRRFLQAGQERGYNVLHPEVALYLRLYDITQPREDIYWIAMEPILARDGNPSVFVLGRDEDRLWLDGRWTDPRCLWPPGPRLVFSARK